MQGKKRKLTIDSGRSAVLFCKTHRQVEGYLLTPGAARGVEIKPFGGAETKAKGKEVVKLDNDIGINAQAHARHGQVKVDGHGLFKNSAFDEQLEVDIIVRHHQWDFFRSAHRCINILAAGLVIGLLHQHAAQLVVEDILDDLNGGLALGNTGSKGRVKAGDLRRALEIIPDDQLLEVINEARRVVHGITHQRQVQITKKVSHPSHAVKDVVQAVNDEHGIIEQGKERKARSKVGRNDVKPFETALKGETGINMENIVPIAVVVAVGSGAANRDGRGREIERQVNGDAALHVEINDI